MIRTENAQLVNYIYVDMHDRDIGGYVADAQRELAQKIQIPPGYRLECSGQFEYLERANTGRADGRRRSAAIPVNTGRTARLVVQPSSLAGARDAAHFGRPRRTVRRCRCWR
jgi:hypothetical protein